MNVQDCLWIVLLKCRTLEISSVFFIITTDWWTKTIERPKLIYGWAIQNCVKSSQNKYFNHPLHLSTKCSWIQKHVKRKSKLYNYFVKLIMSSNWKKTTTTTTKPHTPQQNNKHAKTRRKKRKKTHIQLYKYIDRTRKWNLHMEIFNNN